MIMFRGTPAYFSNNWKTEDMEEISAQSSNTYGAVWDVEKMSLPHIRRKTGPHARPFGQVMYMNRGGK